MVPEEKNGQRLDEGSAMEHGQGICCGSGFAILGEERGVTETQCSDSTRKNNESKARCAIEEGSPPSVHAR